MVLLTAFNDKTDDSASESDEEDEDDPRAQAAPARRRRVSDEEEDSGALQPSESVDVEALAKSGADEEEEVSQAIHSEILGVQVRI